MRIQKYLSQEGICSRREAESFISRGLVSVNGKVVREPGTQIDPGKDKIKLLNQAETEIDQKTTVIINKPRGIASSRSKSEGKTIYELFPQYGKLDIIGRLDKASEGLLMLSNDGALARAITGEEHITEKEYEVTVREETNNGRIKSLEPGVELDDGMTLPAKTLFVSQHVFRITLREGRKHQIRRMCQYLNLTVVRLRRLRIGPITLGGLPLGQSRTLRKEEVAKLKMS